MHAYLAKASKEETPGCRFSSPRLAQSWTPDTLRSAITQTWKPKEIIVADDGSADKTLAIVKPFESGNLRIVPQENQGAAAARNKA